MNMRNKTEVAVVQQMRKSDMNFDSLVSRVEEKIEKEIKSKKQLDYLEVKVKSTELTRKQHIALEEYLEKYLKYFKGNRIGIYKCLFSKRFQIVSYSTLADMK